jgi:hypothetical protein
MTVYLEVGGRSLHNLCNVKNISTGTYEFGTYRISDPNWKPYNQLGKTKGYLIVDDFSIEWCDFFEEVICILYKDIVDALKKDKTNENDTFIEVFNLDSKLCTGTDKYSQLVQDCKTQIEEIEKQQEEKNKQYQLNKVKDLIKKEATKCFSVKAHLLVYVEGGMFSTAELKNRNINAIVYAKNESIVRAWVKKHNGKVSTLEITREEHNDVFACHARLPELSEYGFGGRVDILDAKDYELEKETV